MESCNPNIPDHPPSRAAALHYAKELELAMFQITNGERKVGALPMEPIARLIAFVRTGNTSPAILTNPSLIVNTKANDACLHETESNEPLWTLCARDLTADLCVDRWMDLNIERLGSDHPKILRAIATRDAMEAWPVRRLAGVRG